MVKSRRPPAAPPASPSSQQRSLSTPPLASLALSPLHHKPSKSFTPLISSLKRTPLLHIDLAGLSMDPESPCQAAESSCPTPSRDRREGTSLSFKEISNIVEQVSHSGGNGPRKADSQPSAGEDDATEVDKLVFTSGRQRLQHHWIQMGGKVIIPDTWGREQHLQEWVSYGIVEDALRPAGLMSARTALMSECQRRGSKPVRTTPAMSADVEVS